MKQQPHKNRQTSKLITLTIIFAWLPASLLALFIANIIYHTTIAVFTDPNLELIVIYWLCFAALAGYTALCSVCFGFKMPPIRRLLFLIAGVLAIIAPYRVMLYQSSKMYMFDYTLFNFLTLVFATGPVIFGLIHIVLHIVLIKRELSSPAN